MRRSGDASWTAACALAPNAITTYDFAIEHARKALANKPKFYLCLTYLGAILSRSGHLREAEDALKRALEFPTDFNEEARYFLAMTEYDLGASETAVQHLKAVEESESRFGLSHRRMTSDLLKAEAISRIKY